MLNLLRVILLLIAAAALTALAMPLIGWPDARTALLRLLRPAAVETAVAPPVIPPQPQQRPEPATLPHIRALVEARIAASLPHASYFNRLRILFPGEYSALIDAIAQPLLAAGVIDGGDADGALLLAMRRLRQTHGILAAKASLPTLEQIPRAQSAIMKALKDNDPKLCGDFFYGGGAEGFLAFAHRNPGLVSDLAAANLEAVADGSTRVSPPPEPGDDDIQSLDDALAGHGLSRTQIDLLLDNKIPDPPLDDSSLCAAGVAYLDTLLSLPDAVRWGLLSRSAALAART